MASLFERIGGAAAVDAAVDIFYDKVLNDVALRPFFDGVDMDYQRNKQKAFVTMAFGGPGQYTGRDLRQVHAHLVARGMTAAHFDAVGRHLRSSLEELAVGQDLIAEVMAIIESTRNDVLNR